MSLNLYPIIKQLGNGGFGKTFLATNTLMPSQPYCVVKQLIPTTNDPNLQTLIQDRFGKEGLVLERLGEHSNGMIPKLYAYFMEEGEFYLVQEYISGQTLLDRVKSHGLFTEIQARQLLIDLLPTLTYVHSQGMVHRDIKPDNIMIRDTTNKPVLIDFGAVKETMSTTQMMSGNAGQSIVIGTPGFMPAEQVSGRPMFASDIYALGLTVVYLLTGRMPRDIDVDPASGSINWQVHAPNLSPQLTSILNTAIHPIPNGRYASAQDMLNALGGAVAMPMNPSGIPSGQAATTVVANAPMAGGVYVSQPVYASQPVYPPSQTQYVGPQPTEIKAQGNPLIAAVIGVLVGGGLIAGGLILGKNFTESSSTKSSPVAETKDAKPDSSTSASPTSGQSTSSSTAPTSSSTPASVNNSSPITRESATQLLNQWLTYKRVLFAPPYDKSQGSTILSGKAYRDNIDKSGEGCSGGDPDDCLSSVDWLKKYNAQYSFGVQRVDSIDRFEASGDSGTIFATITEFRTLHKTGGRTTSSGGTKQARYDLKFDNGKVKINDYKVLN
jgi:serine/threonine protein kinase